MNLVQFLQDITIKGWKLWSEGEQLNYDAPDEQSTSLVLAQLKKHKAEVIQLLQNCPDIFNVHPLSHGQKALWVLWQLAPLSAACNMIFSSRICSDINTTHLRTAFEILIERHHSLGSTFPKLGEEPIQQGHLEKEIDFEQIDASAWSQSQLYSSVFQESQSPFDIEHGPVMRVRLFTCSQQEHILLLAIHHIAADGWSLDILLQELSQLYQAQQQGVCASLPTLKHSLADYVRWQQKILEEAEGERLWNYWRGQLSGELPVLNLPIDKPRPLVQTYNGDSYYLRLSSKFTQQLKQLAQKLDATLFMTLLAAFDILLHRYTGQENILVGSPNSGRSQSQFRSIVGHFADAVVLRTDLSNNPSFEQVVAQVRETVCEALSHQDYPFDLLVQKLQLHRDLIHSPIFQVSFSLRQFQKSKDLQNLFVDESDVLMDWGGLRLGSFKLPQQAGRFDLSLEIYETEKSLCSIFNYNTDLFNRQTIERMSSHFQVLLEAVTINPYQQVSQLSMLTEAEVHKLLYEWNDTALDYPCELCIHQLFEQQVEQTPEAVAVVFEDQHLTYRALNQKANQLAHYLQSLGVGPDVPVGIYLERSMEMLVGILGVLKAGGAYVPLDPNYPQERLAFMIEDSQVPVLLTQEHLTENLPAIWLQVLLVEDLWPTLLHDYPQCNPPRAVTANHLAYVIYTSGSTGTPKGVMVEHKGACNLATAQVRLFNVRPDSCVLQFASSSFDASVWEWMMALCSGAKLCLCTPAQLLPGAPLLQTLSQQSVTHVTLPPSVLAALPYEELPSLQTIIVAGEKAPPGLVAKWSTGRRFFNAYGPTESTVCATVAECIEEDNVLIGRPIANTQIYLLDQQQQPVPIGVSGEIYIGGVGIARGYLNQPELTEEKFVPNPFNNSPEALLYRTGDLARYRPDGNLEFIGRIDDQVKLRGFRIELGEIEAALLDHPAVGETSVLVPENDSQNKQLVAYIVPSQEHAFPVLQLLRLKKKGLLKDKALHELPNGLVVAHLNKNETEFIYQEIWEDQTYLKNGIAINAGDCIFDVGANIGLFTLWASQMSQDVSIYAFEPIPPIFELLRFNTEIYGSNVKLFDCGLSSKSKIEKFTYYPHISGMSGRLADANEEREVVKSLLLKQQEMEANQTALSNSEIDELLIERLESQQYNCHLRTISDVLQEHAIERIDLLKIDVEKSELDVLSGIRGGDWHKIHQVVIEVHDIDDRLEKIAALLRNRGYQITIDHDALLANTGLHTIYARQPSTEQALQEEVESRSVSSVVIPTCGSSDLLISDIRHFLKKKLPEYMVPAFFVLLDELPLTPNGKIDRKALPKPEIVRSDAQFVAPRTPIEKLLVNIWKQVLGLEQVSVHDNFFEVGGHSLLATQLISRIRDSFTVELPLRELFAQPTIAGLAQVIQRVGQSEHLAPSIIPVSRDEQLPLSFAQQRLWFLDQLEGANANYNVPAVLRLTGSLDVHALQQCLNTIIQRHETLRTSFQTVEGMAFQVIAEQLAIPIKILNLEALDEATQTIEVQKLIRQEAQEPFDLATGPLIRVKVLQLESEEQVLLLTMHHIISDGWSMGVLVEEVTSLYQAFTTDTEAALPTLPVQYADFAHWQRQYLQGEVLENHLSYWKKQLADAPPLLELPTDRPRPAVQSFQGSIIPFALSAELTRQLQQLSQEMGTTLFMTLLSAFQVLLYRYSGQEDIVVGSPIANRNHSEIENLIGFFVNTLALRSHLDSEMSFEQLLKQVRQTTLDAYTHQDVPFEKLVDELQPERSLSYSPLFQVMFVLQNAPMGALALRDLQLQPMRGQNDLVKFNLTVSLTETEQGIKGDFEYNTDLFDKQTVERMNTHFQILLEHVTTNPYQQVSQLSMLTEAEVHKLLYEWNDTALDYPCELCIHQLFEQQVEQTPEAVAVVFEDQHLTYRALNQKANQLAHYLQSLGVGPDVPVGICLERSMEMLVGILGVLKAGGAYVPLDPNYPQERLAFMIEDSQVNFCLVQQHLLDKLPEHQTQTLCLDTDWEVVSLNDRENLPSETTPNHLAYVIYTSGSTGTPKGVMVEHQSVVRLVKNSSYVDFSSHHIFLQLAPITFDAATFEIWGALLNGANLVLMPEAQPSLAQIAQSVEEYRVSTLWLTAGLFHLMVEHHLEQLHGVRQLLAGGDVLSVQAVQQVTERLPECILVNGYGPTEGTTFSSAYRAVIGKEIGDSVPIGRPIANTQIYVLDTEQQPVPIGVSGEIYIGGAGVARGYLNRPELTAQKFIADPFSSEGRLYRTGDLARYRPDGNLEFIGRVDNQVKLRGFRIELGEIEAALSEHPQVQQVVVIVQGESADDKHLVAYVVGEKVSIEAIRKYLSEKLPEYMVPAFFVLLDELPLTPNGKIDRKALPKPEIVRSDAQFVAPRTPIEKLLVNIWKQVLGLEQVSVHDNFFEVGGHSLLATQLISRIRDSFTVELPLRELFAQPTIAGLAQVIQRVGQSEHLAPSIIPVSRDEQLPLSFAQQRLWFLDQLEGANANYKVSAVLRLTGSLDVHALQQCLNTIIQRHETLRTSFQTVEGMAFQVIAEQLAIPIKILNLEALDEATQTIEVQKLIRQEAQEPFDLATGPLIRVKVLQLESEEQVLLLTMHHIISDGWSMGVLVEEVTSLYQAFTTDTEAALPTLPVQYADFAHWQRQYLQGEVLENHLSYWKKQLADAPPLLELPTDRPRPAVQSFQGSIIPFALSAELTRQLQQLSQEMGTTLFMTLLSAFQVLLYRYSGQEDIVVGSPIANRNHSEIENLIGFFVNTLALRSHLDSEMSFEQLLKQVRQTTLDAYTHQDVPFEKLVDELQPERSLSYSPLFQVSFVLQNAPMGALALRDLQLQPMRGQNDLAKFDDIAKFDLTVSLTETEQGIKGDFEYNTDLFDKQTVERMNTHFQILLEHVTTNPYQQVSQLSMLTEAEVHKLLYEWNDTALDYPCELCIHQLFEQQVEQTPEAVAVVFEDQHLTYRALNQKANQLAHYLQSLGVDPDVPVGICLERSMEMLVGILGVLKAGGAYVPLDPNYPQERLAFMIEDSQVTVLLTQEHLTENLPVTWLQVLLVEDLWPTLLHDYPQCNPPRAVTANHLAYVIYTSGSTGTPKGVMVEHKGACNLATAQVRLFNVRPDSCVLQFASSSFDASVWEWMMALCSGAKLCLCTPAQLLPGAPLLQTLSQQSVTHVTLPPSVLAALPYEELPSLQTIIVAGEKAPPGLVAKWSTGRRFFNAYGPTESTVCATVAECIEEDNVLIGRPIANTQIYLLDQQQQPVPIGVSGEIYIGGVGIARGYLNQPELTEEKFVPNPFNNSPEALLYRTGDLARYRPDGNLEFIGRIDDQVKLRGFRIELGEIEAALSQHIHVKQALVTVQEESADSKRLVAYVLPAQTEEVSVSDLREYLKEKLPQYMIPNFFVLLDEVPLTPNGKLDRKALPKPQIIRSDGQFVAPRNATEEILVNLWKQVLGLEEVSIHDNFFEVGGDSILSIQIVARAHQLELHFSVKQLFEHKTIAQLAAVANINRPIETQQGLLSGEVLLTPIQRWFFEQLLQQKDHFNQAVLLKVPNDIDTQLLPQVLSLLLEQHDALRLRFTQKPDGRWKQEYTAPPLPETLPLSIIDLSSVPQGQQAKVLTAEAEQVQQSLNLEEGPILRCVLFPMGSMEPARLLLVVHHLAIDGVSWRILLEDFANIYQQLQSGQTAQLPAKSSSFQQWAKQLHDYAQTEVVKAELDFWLGQDYHQVQKLPLDFAKLPDSNRVADSGYIAHVLSVEHTHALLQQVPAAYNTQVNDVLLAALLLAYSRWSGQSHLLLDLEGHGREELELAEQLDLSRTVGWFTNIYPVVLHKPKGNDLGELLKSVKEQLRSIPQKGIGYGMLRYLSEDEQLRERLKELPSSQIVLNYLGQTDALLEQMELFGIADESTGQSQGLSRHRAHLLEMNALMIGGQLQLQWSYSQQLHKQETVERLGQLYLEALEELIGHCVLPDAGGYTPSDFPEAELSQQQLDQLLQQLDSLPSIDC